MQGFVLLIDGIVIGVLSYICFIAEINEWKLYQKLDFTWNRNFGLYFSYLIGFLAAGLRFIILLITSVPLTTVLGFMIVFYLFAPWPISKTIKYFYYH